MVCHVAIATVRYVLSVAVASLLAWPPMAIPKQYPSNFEACMLCFVSSCQVYHGWWEVLLLSQPGPNHTSSSASSSGVWPHEHYRPSAASVVNDSLRSSISWSAALHAVRIDYNNQLPIWTNLDLSQCNKDIPYSVRTSISDQATKEAFPEAISSWLFLRNRWHLSTKLSIAVSLLIMEFFECLKLKKISSKTCVPTKWP